MHIQIVMVLIGSCVTILYSYEHIWLWCVRLRSFTAVDVWLLNTATTLVQRAAYRFRRLSISEFLLQVSGSICVRHALVFRRGYYVISRIIEIDLQSTLAKQYVQTQEMWMNPAANNKSNSTTL